jgi:hypothetical protein
MKIGFSLIRKEADTYRSQGLHEEALELYANFIACSAQIDPGTKSAIAKEIHIIELEMNCGDTVANQELSGDRIEPIKKSWGESTIESDLLLCAQDQAQPAGCKQKDESDIKGLDWADGMVDIYALVSNDKDHSSFKNAKGKSVFLDTEALKVLLNQNLPKRKHFYRDYSAKSFLKSIVVFVLIGSIFIYFVDWFSEAKRDKSGEVVQKAPAIVFKKMPIFVSNEPKFTLPNNGVEYQSAMLSKEEAVIGDTQPVVDPAEMQEVVKNLSSPTNDNKTADKPQATISKKMEQVILKCRLPRIKTSGPYMKNLIRLL